MADPLAAAVRSKVLGAGFANVFAGLHPGFAVAFGVAPAIFGDDKPPLFFRTGSPQLHGPLLKAKEALANVRTGATQVGFFGHFLEAKRQHQAAAIAAANENRAAGAQSLLDQGASHADVTNFVHAVQVADAANDLNRLFIGGSPTGPRPGTVEAAEQFGLDPIGDPVDFFFGGEAPAQPAEGPAGFDLSLPAAGQQLVGGEPVEAPAPSSNLVPLLLLGGLGLVALVVITRR